MSKLGSRLLKVALLSMFAAANSALAIEFKTVGAAPAILYDAPSERGHKVFVAPRGMPVEVILVYGEWTKVRDASGDLTWIDTKQLNSKRNLVVVVANAKLRANADDNAPVILTAERGVLLELTEPAVSGWLKVRHRDGVSAFVKANDVWGD